MPYLTVLANPYLEIISGECQRSNSYPANLNYLAPIFSSSLSLCVSCQKELHQYMNVPNSQLSGACQTRESDDQSGLCCTCRQQDVIFEMSKTVCDSETEECLQEEETVIEVLKRHRPAHLNFSHPKSVRTDSNDSGIRTCLSNGCEWSSSDDNSGVFNFV